MKSILIHLILGFILSNTIVAQNNLIRNGSFEQTPSGCVNPFLCSFWSEINSSDLACGSSGYQNRQAPKDSFNYYGMATLSNEFTTPLAIFSREMIQQQLAQPLIANKKYCCRFYINVFGPVGISHSNFGAYFSSTATNGNPMALWWTQDWIEYTPQVKNPIGVYPDTTNWLEVSGTFVANGTEQFITLGNFDSTNVLDYIVLDASPGNQWTYVWIDCLSLVEVSPITLQPKHTLCLSDSVS